VTGDSALIETLLAVSAPFAGGLSGVALQPDFAHLSLRAKAWRVFISVLVTLFVGPYVVDRFFPDAPPSESTFWSFLIAGLAFAVGPVIIKRVVAYAKRVNINLREDV